MIWSGLSHFSNRAYYSYLNTSAPFHLDEHLSVWKSPRYVPWNFTQYRDFNVSPLIPSTSYSAHEHQLTNQHKESCRLPTFWQDSGQIVTVGSNGCLSSDFDQYGDMEAFGVHPDWQRQLSKFASVQDRLREWKSEVMEKLTVFSCMAIKAFDIDAIRVDKATQLTVDALAIWSSRTRACATPSGRKTFSLRVKSLEVTLLDPCICGVNFIYGYSCNFLILFHSGRGRTPTQLSPGFLAAANITAQDDNYFLWGRTLNALDGVAFQYSIYRALTRFLGMDGNLEVAYHIDVNFITAWNQMFVSNDFINANTGLVDPRNIYGTSNFDVFRWPSIEDGSQRSVLATFITTYSGHARDTGCE